MTSKVKKKRKERNPRLAKEDIDLLGYDALINKVLMKMVKKHGKWIFLFKDDLYQEGHIGLLKAHNVYDPTKGTFVTIAYLKVYTQLSRFIIKEAKLFSKQNSLEEIGTPANVLKGFKNNWQDLFPSYEIDYAAVVRLGVKKELDQQIVYHLVTGTFRRNIAGKLGISEELFERRMVVIKDNLTAVCAELYDCEIKTK